jgi:radical SAM family uncharacterized protein/radical SAM-linked protein
LGNEWGAFNKPFASAETRLVLAFPDLYELGMSNFGLKILYQIVNKIPHFLVDRSYAPASDMEALLRQRNIPLWAWETRQPLSDFELVGFSLQYELTYTNVLNMLDLAKIPIQAKARQNLFPLIFGGGPSAVNPEPMADFMDFFMIGDGEAAVPQAMEVVRQFKRTLPDGSVSFLRRYLLWQLATSVPGVYVPSFYGPDATSMQPKPMTLGEIFSAPEIDVLESDWREKTLPERVMRQVQPLSDDNQPTTSIVPYLNLVHDREVLEVRRGCDRGCRFCQPGYTFLPVRERSADDLLRLSTQALAQSGHQEYSMLSLCVSDYTSLHESVRALNEQHSSRRSSLSFPSQRADRMNLDLADELKAVRKSGITLAPEAGTERLRAVINKGLSHTQIISAIEAAYQSGWSSVKLYFMCGLPTEKDEDMGGIIDILKEANNHCRMIRRGNPAKYKRDLEITCTISNFVPKPFTPFQWFAQITPEETERRHKVLRQFLRNSGLRHVQLNMTNAQTSLLEAVISRGGRETGEMIYRAYQKGAIFDAWDDRFKPQLWHETAADMGLSLQDLACTDRAVGSDQPWDVVHIGLNTWWLVKEWEKAMATLETPPCTENLCHACGVCTELETTHKLAVPKKEVMKRNPFVKELDANSKNDDHHPSLFFAKPPAELESSAHIRIRFRFTKYGNLRFISHLDLQHLLARAARRAGINIAYTQGFNPQPKLNLAAPLALFQESIGELGEVDLAETLTAEEFRLKINDKLPIEVQLTDVVAVPAKANGAALQAKLGGAVYKTSINEFGSDPNLGLTQAELLTVIKEKIDQINQSPTFMIACATAGKEQAPNTEPAEIKLKDVRSAIRQLCLVEGEPITLLMELAHGSKQHLKPTDVLANLLPNPISSLVSWKVLRTELKSENNTDLFSASLSSESNDQQ